MLRAAILAAAAAMALGGGALMTTSAAAAPVVAAADRSARAERGLIALAQHYRPRRYYRARISYPRPLCFWSDRRVWNGWRWVVRPMRICR